mgnify:CR=1 FL=1
MSNIVILTIMIIFYFSPPPHFNVQMSVTIERSFLDILIEINDFDKFL